MKAGLMDGALPGSIAACHKAGWIQKESFTQWLKLFFVLQSHLLKITLS